ncbi:MAG TPA: hypothetical protein VFS51_02950 [Gemmatimonadales bacterium]|nr:hypothetical protein [Gemmatimonadales bacterium]
MGRPPGRPRKTPIEVVEPQEPEEDFSDVSGNPNAEFALENQDPSKKYCWVHNERADRLRVQSLVVGWRPVKYAGDDVAPFEESGVYAVRPPGAVGIYAEGEEIVSRDHVLYECNRAFCEKRHRYLESEHTKNLRRNKRYEQMPSTDYRTAASGLSSGQKAGLVSTAGVSAFQE